MTPPRFRMPAAAGLFRCQIDSYVRVITPFGLGEQFHERAGASTLPAPRRLGGVASQRRLPGRRGSFVSVHLFATLASAKRHTTKATA